MKTQRYSAVHQGTIASSAGAARSELRAGQATAGEQNNQERAVLERIDS